MEQTFGQNKYTDLSNHSHLIKDDFLGDSLQRTISSRDFHIDPLTSLNEHKNMNSKAYCSSIHSEMPFHFDPVSYSVEGNWV